MKHSAKSSLFWTGMSLFIVPGLLHAYLLMPFPGSQDLNAITLSFYLEKMILPLRILGGLIVLRYLFVCYAKNSLLGKITEGIVLGLCLLIFYFTDFKYKAETMFEEPQSVKFANAIYNKVPENFIVIGVVNKGIAKAYPLIYLGYHHKVQDNVGAEPVLITYCTMCRTGRVYSPVINGVRQNFRLVGARNYNAVIEDEGTKTWWFQATGDAAAGKLKGRHLLELPYEQSTLASWLSKHPGSLILQPDNIYMGEYINLKNYDRLQAVDRDSTLKNKDTLIRKSWMVGVIVKGQAKAYDWRQLFSKRLVNDEVNHTPLLLTLENDSMTYHAFNTLVNGKNLHFKLDKWGELTDKETASVWDWDGLSTAGLLKGSKLNKIQAYQEYWHSWKHFHPNTLLWKN